MCKYCKQIAEEQGLAQEKVHAIIDRFVKLQEADGLYLLEIDPKCLNLFEEEGAFDDSDYVGGE